MHHTKLCRYALEPSDSSRSEAMIPPAPKKEPRSSANVNIDFTHRPEAALLQFCATLQDTLLGNLIE